MSWYTDPELFVSYYAPNYEYYIDRIVKNYNIPLIYGDISGVEELNFSKHLSLGHNKESDYDDLKSSLATNYVDKRIKFVNCQGLVVDWDETRRVGTWSRVEEHDWIDCIFYSLPGFEEQMNLEEDDRQALQTQVSDLTAILEESRGAGSGSNNVQPWTSGDAVPSHWVPFEDLDVLSFPRNTPPLEITKGPSMPTFVEDVTTNVQISHIHRGAFIVVINVSELTPDNYEQARFDPEFWGLYINAEISYAARKLFESEMSV